MYTFSFGHDESCTRLSGTHLLKWRQVILVLIRVDHKTPKREKFLQLGMYSSQSRGVAWMDVAAWSRSMLVCRGLRRKSRSVFLMMSWMQSQPGLPRAMFRRHSTHPRERNEQNREPVKGVMRKAAAHLCTGVR